MLRAGEANEHQTRTLVRGEPGGLPEFWPTRDVAAVGGALAVAVCEALPASCASSSAAALFCASGSGSVAAQGKSGSLTPATAPVLAGAVAEHAP